VDVQLWPYRNDMDPRRWLANFEEEEMGHAVALLNSFLYFSEQLVDELFVAASPRSKESAGWWHQRQIRSSGCKRYGAHSWIV
jgi:hypothetical protein